MVWVVPINASTVIPKWLELTRVCRRTVRVLFAVSRIGAAKYVVEHLSGVVVPERSFAVIGARPKSAR